MRHKMHSHSFNRRGGPRKALIKGLVISLVEHERIHTTLAKAKELRRHVERAISLGQNSNLGTRRLLTSRFGCDETAAKIMNVLSPRFKARPGGYTRILKTNARPGDMAPMAIIEFVDYKIPEASKEKDTKVVGDKDAKKKSHLAAARKAQKRKSVRTMKANSRRLNRGQ